MPSPLPVGAPRFSSLLFLLLAGCAASSSTARPGIQPEEERILSKSYYWSRDRDPRHFTDAEIKALFDQAPQVGYLDGERSELFVSRLVWAAASAGDHRFAALLSREPVSVQSKVLHFIDGFLTKDYRRVRALPGNRFLKDGERAQQEEQDRLEALETEDEPQSASHP